ncbi:MAG TPA: hypothetical protein VFY03_11390 [Woeseiaceae bacterium]|nr:hypothetical protein [Woeseiaceae bacterium]
MEPPGWALEQRKLFAMYDEAVRLFDEKFVTAEGYLDVVERWGGNDGPDDAMESFAHWPLVYALGGPEVMLELYEKAWEGHLVQFTNARVPGIEMARDGMYYREFITSFDWEHNGEGLAAFNFYGLARPDDPGYRERVVRFAGFYNGDDPEARNYDPEHRIIRSLHNGSRGPKLTHATEEDWGGLPVDGDPERLSRYSTAGNIRGDHPLNLAATTLALNAYMLTGDEKYRRWLLEYAEAWRERVIENGGNIPTNIGLDGTVGGEWGGKWYGGVFGWNFWPQSNSRNYVLRGPRIGFGNAFLLTGDMRFVEPLRRQLQNLYAASQAEGSEILLPNKYGDDGWYGYRNSRRTDVLRDIWLWSMDPPDLELIEDDPWVSFLLGNDPGYPVRALREEQQFIADRVRSMRADTSTRDERRADTPQAFNPVNAGTLVNLTAGGNNPDNAGNSLHVRVRYFDPVAARAGLPGDVAALVDKITAEGIELILVNTNDDEARTVVLQAGAYGEHEFTKVTLGTETVPVDGRAFRVELAPAAGSRLLLGMGLYSNDPSLRLYW